MQRAFLVGDKVYLLRDQVKRSGASFAEYGVITEYGLQWRTCTDGPRFEDIEPLVSHVEPAEGSAAPASEQSDDDGA